jgi:hypothetical protein
MTEQAIRHRGAARDSKGKYSGGTDTPVQMIEFAPGGGSRVIRQARDGETIVGTAYFEPGTDIQDGDDLTVRGQRYRTIVNGWDSGGQGGVEVLCTKGQG